MIGTLLEDLSQGLPFSQVEKRFRDKMNPTKYQRPQALPSRGNVKQAEDIIKKMGVERSFYRRFATLDEIQKIWIPVNSCNERHEQSLFSHLKTKEDVPDINLNVPTKNITWVKFQNEVLPKANNIRVSIGYDRKSYMALVTAVHEDAPNILQWDNTFSWYVYSGGSTPRSWNLLPGTYVEVNAISYLPHMWGRKCYDHHGKSVIFILDKARDMKTPSLCLFPEILKSELRSIRSTIESYSKSKTMQGFEHASACGLSFSGDSQKITVKVLCGEVNYTYSIDRWD